MQQKNSVSFRIFVALILVFLLFQPWAIFSESLDLYLAKTLAGGLTNCTIKWTETVEGKSKFFKEVWFGIKTDFLKEALAKFPEQSQSYWKFRDFFLANISTLNNRITFSIGGEGRFKFLNVFQSSADFALSCFVDFDQKNRLIKLTIDNQLEKLRLRKMNLNLRDFTNLLLRTIRKEGKVQIIDISGIIEKMNFLQVRFSRFEVEGSYIYFVAVPLKKTKIP
ncbi:MAG: hypothetical protein HQM08_05635 [Candidatus Riflebacteria bacterium]|nr:hypothetical protein [Candidatus Riflebacteria bacterium]